MTFEEFTSKKILGIPILYAIGGGVVILAVMVWKLPGEPSQTDEPVNEETDAGSDVDYSGLDTQGTVTVVQGGSTSSTATTTETNESWERAAVNLLITDGKATPTDAQAAIHAYLEGSDLTYSQGELKDYAITKLGVPPEPLAVIGAVSAQPALKQFTIFPGSHTVKGVNDNTASKLAMLYYGNGDTEHTLKISAMNSELGPAGTSYSVGTKVNIPGWTNPKYFTTTKDTQWPSQVAAKNALSYNQFIAFNPGLIAPYKVGTKVRVG